ncbi:MAG: PHP domain-containing protein [Nitrospinota bacterium]
MVSRPRPSHPRAPVAARHSPVHPGEPFGDLHVHSDCSDGVDPPEKVVERAAELGFSFLALADHDTVRGVAPARARAKELGLRLIPAVELTGTTDAGDVHILGYFVDVEDEAFTAALSAVGIRRRERLLSMIQKLRALGVPADPDAFFASYPKSLAGRLNLAEYLVKAGLVVSMERVFSSYLSMGRPAYEPVDALTTAESIQIIRRAGGVPVMAHPGRSGVDGSIPKLVAEGLCGLEAYHSSHSKAAAESYRRLAEARGLMVTGGSDCHGRDNPETLLGTVRVPWALVEALESKADSLRQSIGLGADRLDRLNREKRE